MLENASTHHWKRAYTLTQQDLLTILLQMEVHVAMGNVAMGGPHSHVAFCF